MRNKSEELSKFNEFLKTQVIKKECCGFDRHSVFLTKDGHVYTRGQNSFGQLGLGDNRDRWRKNGHILPTRVEELEDIIDIEVNVDRTFCINKEGRVYAFGSGRYSGYLGLGDCENKNKPYLIEALKNEIIIAVRTNACVTYFLDIDGNVSVCGGFNNSASLGLGVEQENKLAFPRKIPDLPAVKDIIPCGDHVFFLTAEGAVYTCGNNYEMQLGFGDRTARFTPTKLNLPPIKQVDGLWNSSLFLTHDGQVFISGELAQSKYLKKKLIKLSKSFARLDIEPIETLQAGRQFIFITKNQQAYVLFESRSDPEGEMTDFHEYDLTVPEEVQKTREYVYYHAPLYQCPQNSLLERQCIDRVQAMDNNWCLKNQVMLHNLKSSRQNIMINNSNPVINHYSLFAAKSAQNNFDDSVQNQLDF